MKTRKLLLVVPLALAAALGGCQDLTTGPGETEPGLSLAQSGKGRATSVTVDFFEPAPGDTRESNLRSAPQGGVSRSVRSDDVILKKDAFALTLAFSERDFATMQDPTQEGWDPDCITAYEWLHRLQTEVQPPNGSLTGSFEFYIRNDAASGGPYFFLDDPFKEDGGFRYLIRISSGGVFHGSFAADGTTYAARDAGINVLKLTQSRGRALEAYSCLLDLVDYVMTAEP